MKFSSRFNRKIWSLIWDEVRFLTALPPALIIFLVFISTGQFVGIQFDFTPIKLGLNVGIIAILTYILYRIARMLAIQYYSYPIVFEKWEIVREYLNEPEHPGLTCHESEAVIANIIDPSIQSIRHITKRVENDLLAFQHRRTNCIVSKFGDSDSSLVIFEKSQITTSEMVHRLKFPPQPLNTVLEYKINSEYGGAQFKNKSEIDSAVALGLSRLCCASGKHIVRPTKQFSLTLIFPAGYTVVPRICVSNIDGDINELAKSLKGNLTTEKDRLNQLVVTLKVAHPLVGLSYKILWDPPRL